VLVVAADHYRTCASAVIAFLALGPRELQHLVVVEFLLEVLAVGEEIEKFVGRLLRLRDAILEAVVEKLFEEVVFTGAAPLDLDEVGRRENRSKQAEIEDVGAVVTCGHHANRHADTRLTGLVGGQEVGRTEQVIVGEVDGELLGVGYLRGDLYGEIGLVLAGKHAVGHLIQDLRQFGGVVLADCKDNRLAYLPADGIAQGVFQKGFAEELVGGRCEEAILELTLLEGLLLVFAGIVGEWPLRKAVRCRSRCSPKQKKKKSGNLPLRRRAASNDRWAGCSRNRRCGRCRATAAARLRAGRGWCAGSYRTA